jgi:predicted ATPase
VLLANPGDLIILEQPELHLHPDAQLELAKFFVAAMRSGRQLLIESHSEHFLNKLRLLTAQASDAEAEILISSIGFLFAERDKQNGLTEFREVKLSRDGSIQDWPKGFFDQGSSAARELFLLNRQRTNS